MRRSLRVPLLMPNPTVTIRALVRLATCAIALAIPSAAFADCSHEIIDQAYKGKITKHYSQACYTAAIKIEPVDGSSYSDIDSIIRDAKRADALRAQQDAAAVSTPGGSSPAPRTQSGTPRSSTVATPPATAPATASVGGGRTHAKPAALAVTQTAPTATTTPRTTELGAPSATPVLDHLAPAHAGDLPLAVIVLGVLAGLLVLAGIAGAVLRRRAARSDS